MSFMQRALIALIVLAANLPFADAQQRRRITIKSSVDGSKQPAWVTVPVEGTTTPRPLLVSLHSWSANLDQRQPELEREANARKWITLQPDFRGRNDRPQACGSDLAVQDVVDAVRWVRDRHRVDARRIYLTGSSGGGHMALLMAGRHPELWAAVSAWVPISDLPAWHTRQRE